MSCKVQQPVCSDCVTYVKSRIKFNTFNTFNNVEHLYDVIDRFGMESDPKSEVLQRYVRRINSLMGVLVHCNTYNIRRKAWTMMPYKDRVFCVNMKKIRIMNKYKT